MSSVCDKEDVKSKKTISTSGDNPGLDALFTSLTTAPEVVLQLPHQEQGAAATVKDSGNEMGISRETDTSRLSRSGRLPGGAVYSRARVREASQVCIRRERKLSNRGLLCERALSAKTGYEPAGDSCQVLPPLLFPNQLNLVAGVEFSCLSTHRTGKVSSVFLLLRKLAGISFMQGSVSSRPSLEEVISLVLTATLRTASPSSWKLTASTLHQSPRSEHPAMMNEPRTDACLLLEISSGNCSRGDRGVRFWAGWYSFFQDGPS